jgi:hypothetical protein
MVLRPQGLILVAVICTLLLSHESSAFSTPNDNLATYNLFDRFRAVCPADPSWVEQFDASLVSTAVSAVDSNAEDSNANDSQKSVWVAVYRSNNNKPSVFVKDAFLSAMKSATDSVYASASASDPTLMGSFEQSRGVTKEAPVAVARLRQSEDFCNTNTWVLDSMRCVLRKEDTDASCDGGSEHTEALTTGIDTLLLHYLSSLGSNRFDGAIRTKATLVSGTLLDDRGFRPVTNLAKDMATHISSLDACLEHYAARAVETVAKSPGAQQRALSIFSLLGRIDREADLLASQKIEEEENNKDDYDPWASVKRYV